MGWGRSRAQTGPDVRRDGIEAIPRQALGSLERATAEAVAQGRVGAFVPASGAASRMFREPLAYRRDPRPLAPAEIEEDAARGVSQAAALLVFVNGLDRFAFRHELEAALAARGESLAALAREGPIQRLLATLLDADGLGYAR